MFREEEGVQLVQEMKSRFSVSMLSSRQQAALPAPPAGPSTSTATYSTLVGKRITSTTSVVSSYVCN
jgi:hypothetical protein